MLGDKGVLLSVSFLLNSSDSSKITDLSQVLDCRDGCSSGQKTKGVGLPPCTIDPNHTIRLQILLHEKRSDVGQSAERLGLGLIRLIRLALNAVLQGRCPGS